MRNGVRERRNAAFEAIKSVYTKGLDFCLAHPWGTTVASAVLLAGSLLLIPRIGAEFMPHLDEGALWVRATMPYTISFDESAKIAPQVREILHSFPEVTTVASELGRPDDGTDPTGFFNVEFYVGLKPYSQWTGSYRTKAGLIEAINKKLEAFPGINFNYTQPAEDAVDEAETGLKSALAVKVFGSNLDTLQQKGKAIKQILERVRGIREVTLVQELGQPSLTIKINRAKIARYGLNVADINGLIQTAIGGDVATQVVQEEKQFDLDRPPRTPIPGQSRGNRQYPGGHARRTTNSAQGIRGHPGGERRLVHLPPGQFALHRRPVLRGRTRSGRRGGRCHAAGQRKGYACRRATVWIGAENTRNIRLRAGN